MNASTGIFQEKKDLHVGGLGASQGSGTGYVTDNLIGDADSWIQKTRDAVADADEYVRQNPWAALGVVAVVSFALGLIVARRA
jgi:hypothetical protein